MADEIIIETTSAEVIEVGVPGPQGPAGAAGTGLETLTQKGDTLYRGETTGERLPIGTTGQILRVSSSGVPEWGAAPASGVSSVNGESGAVVLDGSEIDTSGNDASAAFIATSFSDGDGIYYPLLDSFINTKPVYRTTSAHHVFFENSRWHITDGPPVTVNIIESSDNDNAAWPWLSAWSGDVTKAKLSDVVGRARDTFLFVGDSIPNTSVSGLASVAASGDYDDLSGKPTIPSASSATPSALGVAAAGSSSNFARADHVHAMPTANELGALDSTADLSDLDNPTQARINLGLGSAATAASTDFAAATHAASHASSGSDPLAPSDIGAQSIFSVESLVLTTTAQVTLTAARAKIYDIVQYAGAIVDVKLPSTNAIAGDIVVMRWGTGGDSIRIIQSSNGSPITTVSSGEQKRFIRGSTDSWSLVPVDTHTHNASAITSGTLDIARIPTGTGSTQVALGNHTHTQLHDRSHAITSTSDHTAGNHKVFYSNGSGEIVELALGSSGTVLTSNGATSAPSFAAASGGVGGGSGSVDNAVIRAQGTGGSEVQSSDINIEDATTSTQNNVAITNQHSGQTNSALVLAPKGNGAFIVGPRPDGTSVGGNSRGTNAICIGGLRSQAAQVASGNNSIRINAAVVNGTGNIGIGEGSSSTGASYTTVVGAYAAANGNRAIAIGVNSQGNAVSACAIGDSATVSGVNATAIGLGAAANLRGQFSAVPFNSIYWSGQTTTNAATVLNLDGTATNRFTIAASTALAVDILLVARRSDTADKWLVARRFLGIRRDGSNNTSLIGTVQDYGLDQSAGSPSWTFALTADDTNEALQLEVTGAASETVQWRATAIYRVV